MLEIVVIGRNEGDYVNSLINSIPTDLKVIYVADRCTDCTISELSKFTNVNIVNTDFNISDGRKTSTLRNLGLSKCSDSSDILFLDGDRFVISGDLHDLVGESEVNLLKLEDDIRSNDWIQANKGKLMSGFFSCGVYFPRDKINLILNKFNELFPMWAESDWGIEDLVLGDICYSLNIDFKLNENILLNGSFNRFIVSNDQIHKRINYRRNILGLSDDYGEIYENTGIIFK